MANLGLFYLPAQGRRAEKLVTEVSAARMVFKALGKMSGVRKQGDHLVIPADPRVFDLLTEKVGLAPSDGAQGWYREATARERFLAALLVEEDAVVDHPEARLLRPYQRLAAYYIEQARRVIIADDMGLGKTAETIVGVESSENSSDVLVVCPNSVKNQWRSEIGLWSRAGEDTPVTVVEASKIEKQWSDFSRGWFILNYNNFRAFCDHVGDDGTRGRNTSKKSKLSRAWDWVIFDEAHALKNRKTIGYSAAKSLVSWGMVMLTGTPMGNDVSEVWSLLNILYPKDYTSYWRYYELYVRYVEDFYGRRDILGVQNEDLMQRDLSTRMLRRKKSEVAKDLPEKSYVRLELEMFQQQRAMYKTAIKDWMIECNDGNTVLPIANSLAMLTRLRQIVSTPANFGMPAKSAKVEACIELIKATDQKVIVFTVYRKTAAAIADRLEQENIPGGLLLGGTDTDKRQEIIDSLTSGPSRVLVATIKAGGTGLNLQAASIAIFIDKEWNPIEQEQAENRIHRIGQTSRVTIYNLVCPGTVDELVENLLEKKTAMTEAVLHESLKWAARTILNKGVTIDAPKTSAEL